MRSRDVLHEQPEIVGGSIDWPVVIVWTLGVTGSIATDVLVVMGLVALFRQLGMW